MKEYKGGTEKLHRRNKGQYERINRKPITFDKIM